MTGESHHWLVSGGQRKRQVSQHVDRQGLKDTVPLERFGLQELKEDSLVNRIPKRYGRVQDRIGRPGQISFLYLA